MLFNIPEDVVISIHASTRGATLMFGFLTPYFIFQSTLPREERPSSSCVVHPTTLFQSTLPREERPIRCRFLHAIENFNPRFHERSDHAQFFSKFLYLLYFNPRFHERSDPIKKYINVFKNISIHASTRGATMHPRNYELDSIFQSTLPREERP